MPEASSACTLARGDNSLSFGREGLKAAEVTSLMFFCGVPARKAPGEPEPSLFFWSAAVLRCSLCALWRGGHGPDLHLRSLRPRHDRGPAASPEERGQSCPFGKNGTCAPRGRLLSNTSLRIPMAARTRARSEGRHENALNFTKHREGSRNVPQLVLAGHGSRPNRCHA